MGIDPSIGPDRARELFRAELAEVRTDAALQALRNRWLGRNHSWTAAFMEALKTATPEQKKTLGKGANELKKEVEAAIAGLDAQLAATRRPANAVDITLPGRLPQLGARHPLSLVRDEVIEIFTRLGYQVLEGPEIEDDYHNFEALNMPADHPARDMHDTLYLEKPLLLGDRPLSLLRTHTSAMQIRHMEQHAPPVRLVAIGPVYRKDNLDLTHTPMFHQVEGLVVGKRITLADLKGTVSAMARALFGSAEVRFRPSFFPYTEPSAEVDIQCFKCKGAGCPLCKRSGWIEILGSGMVHPAVFEAVGYDPDEVSGFAFGMGVERVAQLKWGVGDIRLFYENDLRFLEQFGLMKVPLSWIREFVDVKAAAEEIGTLMGVRGLALEGLEPHGDDVVMDFDVTANRPDLLCVIGIAREIATVYQLPLQSATAKAVALQSNGAVPVSIDEPELCGRYVAAVADVSVGSSPTWMQDRLEMCGVRPISNIVDITNYVMLELGQPMHAFDLDKMRQGKIIVRRARSGETMTTLDGKKRTLTPEMLVIADAECAEDIGGVMGGAASEITSATKRLVFEAAYFNPSSIRATSKALGLKTEASTRFERGMDRTKPPRAMARALELLEKIGAGTPTGAVTDNYPSPPQPKVIHLERERIAGLLGMHVPDDAVMRILAALGFQVRMVSDGWDAVIPSWRVDMHRQVDLIEEVGRHHGFEHLPTTFPGVEQAPPPSDPRIARDRRVRTALLGMGFSEAITFAFIETAAAAPFLGGEAPVTIGNPLSEKFVVMRPSLLPGLVDALSHNRRYGRPDVRLFEIGTRFSPSGESRGAAFAWMGLGEPDHWSGARRPVDFSDIKGVVEQLAALAAVRVTFAEAERPYLVPGRAAAVLIDGTVVGLLGQLAPEVGESRDLPAAGEVYVAEVNLDAVTAAAPIETRRAVPLPRYPFVVRDLSILVPNSLSAETVRGTIRSAAPETLVQVREFDRYEGKGIPEGRVSLSMRLTFQSPERTLTDDEVQAAMQTIVDTLTRELQAVQR